MNDPRLDAALSGLSNHMPRAPAELVNDMAKTVGVVETERNRRLGVQPQAAPERTQDVIQKKQVKGLGK
jgi:hypothetical protein